MVYWFRLCLCELPSLPWLSLKFIHCLGSHHLLCLSALSVFIFCVVFWIFVIYLSVIFSIFLHGYKGLVPISQIENFL